ncbi:hypothetical protein EJD97_016938 [Solanum chilense]|uniref:Uncharacterized protein n=1 Tax=Solanum chilense TaxID=4083 RepID=A0A6N2AGZ5_SOLCI|nr:hypothetical protein EJD97_016938 [Solanum chilense]
MFSLMAPYRSCCFAVVLDGRCCWWGSPEKRRENTALSGLSLAAGGCLRLQRFSLSLVAAGRSCVAARWSEEEEEKSEGKGEKRDDGRGENRRGEKGGEE